MHGEKLRGWRKVANALWDGPNDPQIYGALDIDATAILAFIDRARADGHRVTATHVVGRAVAHALSAVPDLNVRLVGDHAIPRATIDVFFITSVGAGRDLSGVKIERADQKSAVAIADELTARSTRMKRGHERDFAKSKRMMDALPKPALRVALRVTSWLVGERGMALPGLALGASPFGSAMVSSVGMLGLPTGFAPLTWMYKVPLLVLCGEISDKPAVVDGRIVARPAIPVTATIDHRYVDGAQIGIAFRAFREYLASPQSYEPR